MVLLVPIALTMLLGLFLAVGALVFLVRGLSATAGRTAAVQETTTMDVMLQPVALTLGTLFAVLLVGGIFLLMLVLAAGLIVRLLGRAPTFGGGPFPMPPFPLPPFPLPPGFPPPLPGLDPGKFLECMCHSIPGRGRGDDPPFGVPSPGEVGGNIWRELERLRDQAERAKREAERWKERIDQAVATAGANASQALRDAQSKAGEAVTTFDKGVKEVEKAAAPFVQVIVENAPWRP